MRSISQIIIRLAFIAFLLARAGAVCRSADGEIVFLRSGQQFSGTSRGVENGILRWELPHGETITMLVEEVDRVECVAPASQTVEELFAGEKGLPGVPPAPTDPQSQTTPAGAPLNSAGQASPAATPGAAATDEPGMYESAFASVGADVDEAFKYCDTWTKRLEIGGRIQRGNTDEDFLNMGLKLEKKSDRRFAQIEGGGQFTQQRRVPTSNRWFLNGTIDFNKQTEDRWVWFAASKNEHDEFANLAYRGSLSTGLGYRFYNEPKKRLVTRLGPGVTYERFYDPGKNRVTPDIFGEIEILWPVYDRTSFEHKTSIYPSMENVDVFRFVSTNGLLIGLDDAQRWSLKLGLRNEYNSRPNENKEKSDYTASFTLVYTRN